MVAIIGFKFLASINFAAARDLWRYDCWIWKWSTTLRIVLDILGADPNLDPEPLSFVSLSEGAKQHNMGKVYSGLYECAGHVVLYLVLVKIRKPTERTRRPGNCGERDSHWQMLLMHFLNKVRFFPRLAFFFHLQTYLAGSLQFANEPVGAWDVSSDQKRYWSQSVFLQVLVYGGCWYNCWSFVGKPFDLGVCLFFLAFATYLTKILGSMIHDKKLLGVCGETELANAKQPLITMMQVSALSSI